MGEWWAGLGELSTYRPSDFLMFAPRTYWRLFELHNQAWWPLPLLMPALGVACWSWLWRDGATAQRAVALLLAATSIFVALAFVMHRYEPINWAARGLAWLMAMQALSLLAVVGVGGAVAPTSGRHRRAGLALAAWALLGHPLLALAAGRPWIQAEVFGLAPDPTALAVLAWLLQVRAQADDPGQWAWRVAWTLALVQCAVGAGTLGVMQESQAVVMAVVVLAAVVAARPGGGKAHRP